MISEELRLALYCPRSLNIVFLRDLSHISRQAITNSVLRKILAVAMQFTLYVMLSILSYLGEAQLTYAQSTCQKLLTKLTITLCFLN